MSKSAGLLNRLYEFLWSNVFSRIPAWIKVIGKNGYRSLKEFLYIVAFSFMPLWLGAILQYLASKNVTDYLNGYLYNGEALLLSATTVGPLMFILVNSEGGDTGSRTFPLKWLYYLLVIGICVIAAALVGLNSAPHAKAANSPTAMWTLSLVISICSVIVWFAIVATNSARESGAAEVMRQDEQDYLHEYGVR